jgi:HlyD family secretion protein
MFMLRFLLFVAAIAAAVGGGLYFQRTHNTDGAMPEFRTVKVSRGDLHINVRATGTVEPEETVDVGAQVMGRIKELGKDLRGKTDPAHADKDLDYGSSVEKGMVLAQIDPAIYRAQFNQASAALAQANAQVLQLEAQLTQANAEWKRAERLRNLNIPSRSPVDSSARSTLPIVAISEADFILAKANAESAKANLEAAKASVLQQQAVLELAKTNLDYTTIISPIDGTIIDRRVNIGQTVVSSLNAPSLFLIAGDLRYMEVWAAVNEVDVAKIKEGTKVHFRVDALPDDVFHGIVTQVRFNASMTQNVVTYTVVIGVENPDLKLLPYLTADVYFEVDQRNDVLLIPNGALRYRPSAEMIVEASSSALDSGANEEASANSGSAHLWREVSGTGKLEAVEITTGASDMSYTEVTAEGLSEGDEIVVGELRGDEDGGEVSNPFAPPRLRGNRNQTKN